MNLEEDSEAFSKTKQRNNHTDVGGEKNILLNIENASCSLMISIPAEEWDDIPSPELMFY